MNVKATWWRTRYYLERFETVGRRAAAEAWLPSLDDLEWKTGRRTPAGNTLRSAWRELTMPPDAWLLLSELIQLDVFGPRGGFHPKASAMKLRACQEITGAVNMRRRHPAIHGRAIMGPSREIVTAWDNSAVDPSWSPYAREACQEPPADLCVLVPRYEKGVTRWLPSDVPAGVDVRLGEPLEHLVFSISPTHDVGHR